jgi:hypothetical protein
MPSKENLLLEAHLSEKRFDGAFQSIVTNENHDLNRSCSSIIIESSLKQQSDPTSQANDEQIIDNVQSTSDDISSTVNFNKKQAPSNNIPRSYFLDKILPGNIKKKILHDPCEICTEKKIEKIVPKFHTRSYKKSNTFLRKKKRFIKKFTWETTKNMQEMNFQDMIRISDEKLPKRKIDEVSLPDSLSFKKTKTLVTQDDVKLALAKANAILDNRTIIQLTGAELQDLFNV